MIQSKALEVNLASSHVDVDIDARYLPIERVMSRYFGLQEGVNTFLKELSHPQKNYQFIVSETRGYSLNYYHLIRDHEEGPEAARLLVEIFLNALTISGNEAVRLDAVDDLLLFLQKMLKETGPDHIDRFLPVLDEAFEDINRLGDEPFFLFVKSFYRLENLGEEMAILCRERDVPLRGLNRMLVRYFRVTFRYWLNVDDPLAWLEKEVDRIDNKAVLAALFERISHETLRGLYDRLMAIIDTESDVPEKTEGLHRLAQLLSLTGYNEIVDIYRDIPQRLIKAGSDQGQANRWKVIFLFHIMNISGLSLIYEETLRDINRTLGWLIENEKFSYISRLVKDTFAILKTRFRDFPLTALSCVYNMGKGIYKTEDIDLVKLFIDNATDLGFQAPMIRGVGNDWQIRMNPAHIQNVRTWLELIELNPKLSTRLLSYLIINLSLTGVFIKDTDLFPRDITRLLNSDIGPVYNLVKQLAKLFPVYFNDIGAEGDLRDISTQVDEITQRKDLLIHFLRKQTHVESSNRVVDFVESVFRFWMTRRKQHVEPFLPPSIFQQISESGVYVDGVHRLLLRFRRGGKRIPADLLNLSESEIDALMAECERASDTDRERLRLTIRLYRLLHQKYHLTLGLKSCDEIQAYLSHVRADAFPKIDGLRDALSDTDIWRRLSKLLEYQEKLKDVILSGETYEIQEDIYKKRHFTVDIPSMYGSYHEMKFDALGLTFRIETVVNVAFEELVGQFELGLITKETFFKIYDLLKLFNWALRLDGIASAEVEAQLELLAHSLETRGFTFTQYLDVFKGIARAVSNVINDHFNNVHENNLNRILDRLPREIILDKYLPMEPDEDPEKLQHRISEIFLRDQISLSLGLRQLDLFLSRILTTLFHQSYKLPEEKLRLLLNYDPQRAMTDIHNPESRAVGIIHLGNKGHNLVKLNELDFPVPPGFIITTEVFRCREIIECYPPAEQNLREQIAYHIGTLESITGKKFGDPGNPLLFSVRSGSSISQPGMMDTFLNVGMNEEIAAGIAEITGNIWFAYDNYRRFLQCYGMAFGLKRDDFDALMRAHKEKLSVLVKRGFSGEQMKELALSYKRRVRQEGIEIIEDPFEQLLLTIKSVLNSWESAKAKAYRKIIGISDDWGTAVTVQSMVYGNLSQTSGTGVFFTHNPKWSEDNIRLWGDFTIGNQGEDVVAGLVNTLPISIIQQSKEMRDTDVTLESHFPEIYQALKEWASRLIYKECWSPQEIEFTFEGPDRKDLYLLQSRNMGIRERQKVFTFELNRRDPEKALLGNGIGVSGGAMSGRVVFTLDDIDKWRKLEPRTHLILLRGDTVPDDIREINAADGLLTARGGVTSHAAVVAHRLDKTCVVGCVNLICNEAEKTGHFDGEIVKTGDFISIDGQEGQVYMGYMKVKET